MNPDLEAAPSAPPQVSILILNYHQHEATVACVRRLLECEGPQSRILWIENDASTAGDRAADALEASGLPWMLLDPEGSQLPPAGTIGLVLNAENLGYTGGNNVGARLCHRAGVPYLWVMNNDTLLQKGSSADLLRAAEAAPEVGVWGTVIFSQELQTYCGGLIQLKDFAIRPFCCAETLRNDPLSFVSGCSLFFPTALGASFGFLPEAYFLYYEDPSFTLEVRRRGFQAGLVPEVEVLHEESLTTGRRSHLMETYIRRNRWHFVQSYFPDHMARQHWRFLSRLQSLFFRGKLRKLIHECQAYQMWRKGAMGRIDRNLCSKRRPRKR